MDGKGTVAVVGAGVAGLVSLKECLAQSLDVTCYEGSADIGGLWRFEDQATGRTTAMRNTVMVTSIAMSCFSDFPPSHDTALFLSQRDAQKYLEDYVDHFELRRHIRFNSTVTDVSRRKDLTWRIDYRDTDGDQSDVYQAVIICTGLQCEPHTPDIPGLKDFKGTVMHTSQYKSSHNLRGKDVLIVGLGNSACDACDDLVNNARKIYLSKRHGAYIINRIINGDSPFDAALITRFGQMLSSILPTWLAARMVKSQLNSMCDTAKFGLESNANVLGIDENLITDTLVNHLISKKVELKNEIDGFGEYEVKLKTGQVLKIDAIILSTGYNCTLPMLKQPELRRDLINDKNRQIGLYKKIFPFHIENPGSLAIIGFHSTFGPEWPTLELEARYVAQVISGRLHLPSVKEMEHEVKCYQNLALNLSQIAKSGRTARSYPWMMTNDDLADQIGCKPKFWKYLFTDPRLLFALLFGPNVSAQYRLDGTGSNSKARNVIMTVPERIACAMRQYSK
ncbi:Dimethylaniline monooxygenase [N-oxide-forming] 2 [Halotydeus destructor]|nr:Dimethylaniline monooxygenase [N-oxide-forming] 2 [Halotydeus destructor]